MARKWSEETVVQVESIWFFSTNGSTHTSIVNLNHGSRIRVSHRSTIEDTFVIIRYFLNFNLLVFDS